VAPLKLFLDMVPSSSTENVTMHIASQGCFSSRIKYVLAVKAALMNRIHVTGFAIFGLLEWDLCLGNKAL